MQHSRYIFGQSANLIRIIDFVDVFDELVLLNLNELDQEWLEKLVQTVVHEIATPQGLVDELELKVVFKKRVRYEIV
jgi:hypothetical protein